MLGSLGQFVEVDAEVKVAITGLGMLLNGFEDFILLVCILLKILILEIQGYFFLHFFVI